MIILLDLNYTLASAIKMDRNFNYDVSKDIYRQDLVTMLLGKRVFLITARTDNYKTETLEKIKKETGLNIERAYFKPYEQRYMKVHEYKKSVCLELFREGFKPSDLYGVESNINTRKEYKSIGIESCRYEQYVKDELCKTQLKLEI